MPFMNASHRHCSRCGLELTDVASMERGIGPICAGKDTHLYAKTIPANYAMANIFALSLSEEHIHQDVRTLWADTKNKLLNASERSANREQINTFEWTGEDLRQVIKNIDYLLSWKHPHSGAKDNLVKIVHHLGYVGLAGVLAGEASTSEATLWFENGEIKLKGKRNRSAYRAFASVRGVKVPRTLSQPYSAPVALLEPFLTLVLQYYPMYSGDFDTIREQAAAWVPPPPVAPTLPVSGPVDLNNDTVLIRNRSEDFTVQFNWIRESNNMGQLIANMKNTVPYTDRKYDPNSRIWSFKKNHLEAIRAVFTNSGIYQYIIVQETGERTPDGTYRSQPSTSSGRYRYRY